MVQLDSQQIASLLFHKQVWEIYKFIEKMKYAKDNPVPVDGPFPGHIGSLAEVQLGATLADAMLPLVASGDPDGSPAKVMAYSLRKLVDFHKREAGRLAEDLNRLERGPK